MFLKAKGMAESLFAQSQVKTTIFRFQLAVNPSSPSEFENYLTFNGKEPVKIIGNGEQPFFVILQQDILRFILAAIELEKSGIYNITSPDRFTLKTYIQTLNNNPQVKISTTPGWLAQILSRFIPDLSPTTVDLYLREQVIIDAKKAIDDFNVVPKVVTPLYNK